VSVLRSGPTASLSAVGLVAVSLSAVALVALGVVGQIVLLAALAVTVGLTWFAWVVGLTCSVVTHAAVARGLSSYRDHALGPADLITLLRVTLVCAVAALTADAFVSTPAVAALVALAATELALDAVDGWVARRTNTSSIFGARFDGEVDALLILVLSVYVAHTAGAWVFAIGAARYVFALAGLGLPWLRRLLPHRYWRKVVAATQGIVLAIAAAGVLPLELTQVMLAVAFAMLVESFGRDVWWLWMHRPTGASESSDAGEPAGPVGIVAGLPDTPPEHRHGDSEELRRPSDRRRRLRAAAAVVTNVLAVLLVWLAFVAPNQLQLFTPGAFFRIPLEALLLAGVALVLPVWPRRVVAAAVGLLLAALTLGKILDLGFFAAFDRPFNLVTDRSYLGDGIGLVKDIVGPVGANLAVVAAVLALLAIIVGIPLALVRLTGVVARHRTWSVRAITAATVVWLVGAVSGLQVAPAGPVASMDSSRLAVGQVNAITAGVRDEQKFEAAAAVDRFDGPTTRDVLAGLRGKDVLVAFVESYGRTAVEGSPSSPRVQALLDSGSRRLAASGYSARSAFLTSPTFGGLSWLAHASLQSGLWVDNERRYEGLLSRNRLTLTRAFKRNNWRTVSVMPSTNHARWPEGRRFYGFDKIYYQWDFGYRGPKFGFSRMPDQYALKVFQRQELSRTDRRPLMAMIELASSHAPWAPLPHMVGWNRLGDGSLYHRMRSNARSEVELWREHPEDIESAFADSIMYSLKSLLSFVQKYGDEDLVLVVLGDHQPATVVTGAGASHDVPITVIAHDPAVLDQISGWGWQDGLRPDPQAPVWPMDAFRDRFLDAFSPEVPQVSAGRER
jgi:phosphatidylglycerophosphate synthase